MIFDNDKFEALCSEHYSEQSAGNIGTYKEKRLHKILKRMVCDDESCYEIKIGNYVADVFDGEHITEIQTANFHMLRGKLEYYLSSTDYDVTVVHPVIASKRILHVDKESGEIGKIRRSPKKLKSGEIFERIYRISEHIKSDRINIVVLYIEADEHRYSSLPVRYRKSGKYDSELFPKRIINIEDFCGADSYKFLLSGVPDVFSAKEYGASKGMSGRPLYATLNLLCELGFLSRSKENSRSYEYTVIKNG